jgi:uncharacterized protein
MKILKYALLGSMLLETISAHAVSFDCQKGRSAVEQMICRDSALSALDDQLGQLFRAARRQTSSRRALIADSDSKWLWREQNCRDASCVQRWYLGRIDELKALLTQSAQPPQPRQCTAADPGMPSLDACKESFGEVTRWRLQAPGGNWFCRLAMVDYPRPSDTAR